MNKFYNFISTNKKHELYVYGEIIGGSNKWDESDVIFDDFKNKLSEMEDNSTLDVYVIVRLIVVMISLELFATVCGFLGGMK